MEARNSRAEETHKTKIPESNVAKKGAQQDSPWHIWMLAFSGEGSCMVMMKARGLT